MQDAFKRGLERARLAGILGWCAILSIGLALAAGKWQVFPLMMGMALIMQADHDRNHHVDAWTASKDMEVLGFIITMMGALAFRI